MERLTEKGNYSTYTRKNHVTVNDVEQRLGEYEDLEEQGLLLHLPCKIGTTVYHVVKSLSYGEVGDKPEVNYRISEVNFNLFMFNFIGESIFLTKEEAEQKLKELTT